MSIGKRQTLLEYHNMAEELGRPRCHCHKCGRHTWILEVEPMTWGCAICGNRIYFIHGALRQQIDAVMNSGRKYEFIYSVGGKTLLPKTADDVRTLRIQVILDRKDAQQRILGLKAIA